MAQIAGLALIGVVALAGCAPQGTGLGPSAASASADLGAGPSAGSTTTSAPTPEVTPAPKAAAPPQSALATALLLEVKGRAPKTGYTRDQFGQAWRDTDGNGCDQRNDVLGRDLTGRTYQGGTNDCVVLTGTLADPFSGASIAFLRGQDTSGAVQIDHVVPLSDAWQKGAQRWDAGTRETFANDPLNLLAVDGPLNAQKRDGDAATWLPPNKSYRCEYVARQVAVKIGYGLWVTEAEQHAMVSVLSGCPDQPLPAGVAPPGPAPEPVPAPAQAPAAAAPAPAPGGVPYPNCAAARAAGAAPVLVGQPGYGANLDRDGDGIGCE